MTAWPPPAMSRSARHPPPEFSTSQYWPTLALVPKSAPETRVACHCTAPLASIEATCTLTELLFTKVYCTAAPEEERTEPTAPQESWPAPLALTRSGAAWVGLGVGLWVGLGLGFGEDFGVDPLDPAAVVWACVAAFWVVGWALGRLDDAAEERGEVRAADADGDGWEVADCADTDVPGTAAAAAAALPCEVGLWPEPLRATPVATEPTRITAAAVPIITGRARRRRGRACGPVTAHGMTAAAGSASATGSGSSGGAAAGFPVSRTAVSASACVGPVAASVGPVPASASAGAWPTCVGPAPACVGPVSASAGAWTASRAIAA